MIDSTPPTPLVPGMARTRDDLVVALDVGGTSVKAALVTADGSVLREARRPTRVPDGPDAVIEGILSFAADVAAGEQVRAVGLGVPGVVDVAAGIARHAANLGWRDVPFTELMAARLGVPVALGHDVRLGALAESRLGAGTGAESVYFVSIGTGIAGGLAHAGQVENGATGQAGEVGHLVVRPGGPLCNCGNRGCLEAIASASRIGQAYTDLTGRAVSARDVVELLAGADAAAEQVWGAAVAALADALAAVTVLTDPGVIVVGGGLSLAGESLISPLQAALAERLSFRDAPPIAVTVLGDRAGLSGAALLAWELLDSLGRAGDPGPAGDACPERASHAELS